MGEPDEESIRVKLARERARKALFGRAKQQVHVGRYRLIAPLGSGAMGVVYRAYDPQLEREVAVKLISEDNASPERRERMLREAKAMARLTHPHVVVIYEVGEHDERIFIAMELVEGENLRTWLDREERTPQAILEVLLGAARGLAAAHERGLVHRDVKPENILIDREGRARIADFGVARAEAAAPLSGRAPHTSEIRSMTATGALVGTPAYMAPEQLRGDGANERSDQFSLCVTLWEALYGARPFLADRIGDLLWKMAQGQLEATPAKADVPLHVRTALLRGLAVDASERFDSMADLVDALTTAPAPPRRPWPWVAVAALVAAAVTAVGLVTSGQLTRDVPASAAAQPSEEAGPPDGPSEDGDTKPALEELPIPTATTTATGDGPKTVRPAPAAPAPQTPLPKIAPKSPPPPAAPRPFPRAAAQALLGKNAAEAGRCRAKGDPAGSVNVMVWFNPSGAVQSVSMSQQSKYSAATGACVASAMSKGKIPAFDDDPTIMRWPVHLQ